MFKNGCFYPFLMLNNHSQKYLEVISREVSLEELSHNINNLRANLTRNGKTGLVQKLFDFTENQSLPPLNRRAITELLINYFSSNNSYGQMAKLANSLINGVRNYHQENRNLDDYVEGATVSFRRLRPPENRIEELVDLMRMQNQRIWDYYGFKNKKNRTIFGQSLLVLGCYGNLEDIPLILEFIEKDKTTFGEYDPMEKIMNLKDGRIEDSSPILGRNNRFLDYTLSSLQKILSRNADNVGKRNSEEVRRVCGNLLKDFTNPDLISGLGPFHYSSSTLRTLSARLDSQDLLLGLKYVQSSGDEALAENMLRAINDSRESLNYMGKKDLLLKREPKIREICGELKRLIKNPSQN